MEVSSNGDQEKYEKLAQAVEELTEFEWSISKSKVDYLFSQKASKLQLERQEIIDALMQR